MSDSLKELKEMVVTAYDALEDKQGGDIKIIDIQAVSVLADYFIIAHGNNTNHIQALVDECDEQLSKRGYEPKSVEGKHSNWILMDYGNLIIHVFNKEDRLFYDLERIWMDGQLVQIEDLK